MKKFSWIKQWAWTLTITLGISLGHFYLGTTNPVNNKAEIVLYSKSSEIHVGNRYYLSIVKKSGGLYSKHPHINDYVSRVGLKLAKVSHRPDLPYEFVVIKNSTPNAWALPGGKIAINTGLLEIIETESELAAVLAHEIVHAAARHRAQDWERDSIFTVAQTLYNIATPAHSLASTLLGGDRHINLKLSRDSEHEADQYSIEYLARAGYNLNAAVSIQEKIAKHFGAEDQSLLKELGSTHPRFASRIASNEELIKRKANPEASTLGGNIYELIVGDFL